MNSGKIGAGQVDGRTDGTGIEGSIRGPRGPKNDSCVQKGGGICAMPKRKGVFLGCLPLWGRVIVQCYFYYLFNLIF